MKKSVLILSLALLGTTFATTRSMAYSHDSHGWYDERHHRHDFVTYRHHRGFWDQRGGSWIFIRI